MGAAACEEPRLQGVPRRFGHACPQHVRCTRQGEWYPKFNRNPAYKGPWVAPEIDNPAFVPDASVYRVCAENCTAVGFELWQVARGAAGDRCRRS